RSTRTTASSERAAANSCRRSWRPVSATSRSRSPWRRSPRARSTSSASRSPPRPTDVSQPRDGRVLLGVTGGVAAYKAAILARQPSAAGAHVTAVLTDAATRFIGADTLAALTGRPAYTTLWERPGEVLHVRLAHETDVAVIAPCTANVIARLAQGI